MTNRRLSDLIKTGLLMSLSAYFAWLIVSNNLPNYINYRFAWLAYVATVLFGLIGAIAAWRVYRQQVRRDAGSLAYGHDGQPRGALSWPTIGIMIVPLLLGTLIPSQPLGADAVGTISTTGGAVQAASLTTFSVAPEQRNVLDWLREFNNAPDYRELNGLPANVVGFVYREPDFDPGTFMVARFTVACCVADASAIGLPIVYADADALQQGVWVRVRGTMQVGNFRTEMLPIVQAASVELVDQPAHPYLYP